jgi:hypothetical protein
MTQDYSNHKKAMTSAEVYVRGNLPTIASEVIDWHRTGILPGNELRHVAKILKDVASHDALGLAESLANRAALEAVALTDGVRK